MYSVKRFMGKSLSDVQDELAYFPYALSEKGGVIRIKLGEKSYSPPQISAMILKELKLRAEAFLGESITKAVITVPAFFNDGQRQATRMRASWPGSRCSALSTNRRPPPGLRPYEKTRARSLSTTWAAAPSTSRS